MSDPNGADNAATRDTVVNLPPLPTITSFGPGGGPVGTNVAITGASLTTASSVTFNGVAAAFTVDPDTQITASVPAGATSGPIGATTLSGTAAAFHVDSSTQITATVPANATSGALSVTTPAGTATSAASFTVAPRITSFTPAHGAAGASVTITGANFTGATAVRFNSVAAVYAVSSAVRITATVPAGAGTGKVSVTTGAGTATSASNFTVP